jgi:hypothetical protein
MFAPQIVLSFLTTEDAEDTEENKTSLLELDLGSH